MDVQEEATVGCESWILHNSCCWYGDGDGDGGWPNPPSPPAQQQEHPDQDPTQDHTSDRTMKHQERPQKKTKKKEEFFLPTSTLLRGRGDSNRPAHQHHRGGGGGGGTTTTTTTTRTTTLPVVRSSRRRGGRGRQKHRRLPSIRPQSPHGTAGGPRADYDDNHNDRDGGRDGGGSASVAGSSSAVAVIGADGAPPPPPPLPSALEGPRATKKRKKATTTTVTKRPREEEEEEGAKQFPKASTLPPAPTTLRNESSSLAVGTPVHAGRGGGARRLGLSWWNTGGAGAAAAAASSSSSPSSDLPNDDAEDVTVVRKRRKHGKRNTDDNDEDAWEEEEGSHERRRLRRLRRLRQECVAFLPPVAAARPTPLQERVWQVALVDVGDHHDKDHATTASSNVRLRSCVVLGPTASGKTLAYGVPLLRKVQGKSVAVEVASSFSRDSHRGIGGGSSVGALVAVPTRELALQVTSDLERAVLRAVTTVGTSATTEAHPPTSQPTTPVAIVACYGGVDKTRQWESLLRAASSKGGGFVVVGTPGRLLDLLLHHLRLLLLELRSLSPVLLAFLLQAADARLYQAHLLLQLPLLPLQLARLGPAQARPRAAELLPRGPAGRGGLVPAEPV